MSCKEHGLVYVEFNGNTGAPPEGYCYQCEIDSLLQQLTEAQEEVEKYKKERNQLIAHRNKALNNAEKAEQERDYNSKVIEQRNAMCRRAEQKTKRLSEVLEGLLKAMLLTDNDFWEAVEDAEQALKEKS